MLFQNTSQGKSRDKRILPLVIFFKVFFQALDWVTHLPSSFLIQLPLCLKCQLLQKKRLFLLKSLTEKEVLSSCTDKIITKVGRQENVKIKITYSPIRKIDVTDLMARLQMMLEVEFAQYLSIFFCHKRIKEEIFQKYISIIQRDYFC